MRTRSSRTAVSAAVAVALLLGGAGAAHASAKKTSGPVTVSATGSGLRVSSMGTSYVGSTKAGTMVGDLASNYWTIRNTYKVGNVCVNLGFSSNNYTFPGATPLTGRWVNGAASTSATLSIHS